MRVRAPELTGRGWLNTAGPLTLADLRGRFVLLDFWTFCCVNCLHVIDELRPLEAKYAEELVVVGVHSPKFAHEADPDALVAAVERYGVHHAVLDDPGLTTWGAYTARAWPTLVLVDPEGYVVAQYAGEGHVHALDRLLGELVDEHRARGTLQPGDAPYVPPAVEPSDLRFPAKAVPLPDGRVLVADAGHDEVVELASADGPVLRRFGGFAEPNGLCLLPDDVAAEVGYDVVVADTVHHQLRGLALATGEVRVLAGDGEQWRPGDGVERLSSPWDVAWWGRRVWVAMAGIHQLWTFDPRDGTVEVAAGTTNEGLRDGPAVEAWLAQTSGLAAAGDRLWLADSEVSAVRWVEAAGAGADARVGTAVGTGLFDFGFRDGPAERALLQHPLGVTALPDGSVAVCDTYNGAVRRWDPVAGELTTLATGLAEPSGAHVDGEHLVVVESAAHRLVRVPLGAAAQADDFSHRTQRPVTEVGATVALDVVFAPPPGQKVDDRFGPATQLMVTATPAALLRSGEGRDTALRRTLELDPAVGEGVLHVAARAASCDAPVDGEVPEGAACHVHQQDWGVPVRVSATGDATLLLPLGGTA
ncbi:NHL domain-containing thioredoxin family protein [Nocardioides solisilvae]|uniref:NHL domain-containing thioredoxin family protein n=1 Tax=Nocardioides solisilvae TaxID=1542435 RepID=UPI000D74A36E|nr:NHL domain-containing thioredoxin family protein [Nocardioides solisilvae]